jgi:hypothetical protein
VTSIDTARRAPSWWRIPKATDAIARWHVSPLVDTIAYHFSWLLILVPLALAGDVHPTDYLWVWAIGMTTSFTHRHVTMPYVYLDGAVFSSFKPRLTLIPTLLMCGFVASLALQPATAPAAFFTPLHVVLLIAGLLPPATVWWRDRQNAPIADRTLVAAGAPAVMATLLGFALLPRHNGVFVVATAIVVAAGVAIVCSRTVALGAAVALAAAGIGHQQHLTLNALPLETKSVVGVVAMIAVVWNIWHTTAQKVGILRIYNAKSDAPADKKVPLWVDRALVFGWFPFLAARLVQQERATILKQGRVVQMYLEPILDGIERVSALLLPVGVLVIVATLGIFLYYEERANGLRNVPRLSMAVGLTLLSASFLFISPLKCYVAYGFSHAVEYVVFVWAFQRRRYAAPLSPPPLLQRILRHGAIFYGLFIGTISIVYMLCAFAKPFGWTNEPVLLMGARASTVIYLWAVWHSLAHFYFDGFLWKMRKTVRASL